MDEEAFVNGGERRPGWRYPPSVPAAAAAAAAPVAAAVAVAVESGSMERCISNLCCNLRLTNNWVGWILHS